MRHAVIPLPPARIADFRMTEQKGLFVFDHAGGPLGHLELANVGWTVEEGRPALKFADNPDGRKDYPRGRNLDVSVPGSSFLQGQANGSRRHCRDARRRPSN